MELTENWTIFGLAGMFAWRMKMLNIYISSYPKGPVALEIKFFKWKFGPTCPLKTQLSLTTIESPNIPSQSHHASFELEELNITKNPHNIAPYLKINLQTHAEFCPFFIIHEFVFFDAWLIPDTHPYVFRQINGNLSFTWARQHFLMFHR